MQSFYQEMITYFAAWPVWLTVAVILAAVVLGVAAVCWHPNPRR